MAVPFHVPVVTVPKKELPETESAVVEAYGNCEAATVDEEKKTPWVRMLDVVAAVFVPKELREVKGYAKAAAPTLAAERQLPLIAKHPPERLRPTLLVEVAEPLMVRPLRVVVPKPAAATERNLVALDDEATSNTEFV